MSNPTNILTDTFGRKHDYLRISLTERCNLRCFYCMPPEGITLKENSEYMTAEEIIKIASVFVKNGIKKIRLTGGEPLVRKEYAFILEELAKTGVELAITTNGILIDKYFDLFKKTGCRSINISLDTFKRDKMITMTKRDYYDRIMDNLNKLVNDPFFKLKLNAVVVKGVNDDEVIDFCRYTINHPVQFRFIEFMPFKGNGWSREASISHTDLLQLIRNEFGNKFLPLIGHENATSADFKIEGAAGSIGLISSVTNAFCSTCNRLRLTANGTMKNCLFSKEESNLLVALRNGENIEELIQKHILQKHFMRGGMDTDQKINDPLLYEQNRSMVSIGG